MKATKQKTEGAVIDLNTRIDRAVNRQLQIEGLQAEQKAERVAIQKLMESAELERQATPTGNEALRVSKQSYTWDPEKLENLLDEDELETYVPRKPDGTKLRNWLDTLEGDEARNLKKCAKVKNSEVLELRAHGAEAAPGSDD